MMCGEIDNTVHGIEKIDAERAKTRRWDARVKIGKKNVGADVKRYQQIDRRWVGETPKAI